MFLQPKRSKYKKTRKGTLPKLEFRSNKLKFGTIGLKAIEQGIARKILSEDELYTEAKRNIEFAQNQTRLLMKEGFIPPFTKNI